MPLLFLALRALILTEAPPDRVCRGEPASVTLSSCQRGQLRITTPKIVLDTCRLVLQRQVDGPDDLLLLGSSFINRNLLIYYARYNVRCWGCNGELDAWPLPSWRSELMKHQPTSTPTTSPAPVGVSGFCHCAVACPDLCLPWNTC